MKPTNLIEQYIDILHQDGDAPPPAQMDEHTASFVRALVASGKTSTHYTRRARVWKSALANAQSSTPYENMTSPVPEKGRHFMIGSLKRPQKARFSTAGILWAAVFLVTILGASLMMRPRGPQQQLLNSLGFLMTTTPSANPLDTLATQFAGTATALSGGSTAVIEHEVQAGETLAQILVLWGLDISDLPAVQAANPTVNIYAPLQVGMILYLPVVEINFSATPLSPTGVPNATSTPVPFAGSIPTVDECPEEVIGTALPSTIVPSATFTPAPVGVAPTAVSIGSVVIETALPSTVVPNATFTSTPVPFVGEGSFVGECDDEQIGMGSAPPTVVPNATATPFAFSGESVPLGVEGVGEPIATQPPTIVPNVTATSISTSSPATAGEEVTVYPVQAGDTLSSIMRRFELSVDELQHLIEMNPNIDIFNVVQGDIIRIPAPATYLLTVTPTFTPTPIPMEASLARWLDIWGHANPVNLLLLGIDQRYHEGGYFRTDTIIVLHFDPVAKSMSLLSIPRDTWVSIPGFAQGRINTANALGDSYAYPGGGPALLARTIQENFGIAIDNYVLVNFDAFTSVVELLAPNGVEVCPQQAINDRNYPNEYYGYAPVYFEAGCQTLQAERLLQYARTRATYGSDFDRMQRQQEVLLALQEELTSLDGIGNLIVQSPALWTELSDTYTTDLTLDQIFSLGGILFEISPDRIRTGTFDQSMMQSVSREGQAVLLPDMWMAGQVIQELFTTPTLIPTSINPFEMTPTPTPVG